MTAVCHMEINFSYDSGGHASSISTGIFKENMYVVSILLVVIGPQIQACIIAIMKSLID
jgi:hypothetical protein